MKKLVSTLMAILLTTFYTYSQGVLISDNTGTPDATAMLEVASTSKGFLIPRMTEAERTAISSPANGLMVYQTDKDAGFYIYYENPADATKSGWSKLPIGYDGYYINFPSSSGEDITLGDAGYGIRSNNGQLEYKNEGDASWTAFPAPPPWGALTIWWYKPLGETYIRPDNNSNIRIYDDGEQNGFYFDGGTNQYGVFVRTTSNTYYPTGAVVGWTDVAGQQTYGYLGYRGHIGFGTSNPQDVWGAAVWGEVPDTNSVAAFFRTYDNANYAALISYSDKWIPAYFYCDDNSDVYEPTTLYSQLDINVSNNSNYAGIEAAGKFLAFYNPNSGNNGLTNGVYALATGNQDAYGVIALGYSDNTGVGIYAYGSSADYIFPKSDNPSYTGIGAIINGDLTGALIKGDFYGLNILGERYGLYVNNLQINEAPIVEMLSDNKNKIPTYVVTSENNDIILKGIGVIDGKSSYIAFNQEITKFANEKAPIIVTVTPVGTSANIYVDEVSVKGFKVATDDVGNPIKFNWIAILSKDTPNIPEEVMNLDYNKKLNSVISGDKRMRWKNEKLQFEQTDKVIYKYIKDQQTSVKPKK